jgi:hypothetical protein
MNLFSTCEIGLLLLLRIQATPLTILLNLDPAHIWSESLNLLKTIKENIKEILSCCFLC